MRPTFSLDNWGGRASVVGEHNFSVRTIFGVDWPCLDEPGLYRRFGVWVAAASGSRLAPSESNISILRSNLHRFQPEFGSKLLSCEHPVKET